MTISPDQLAETVLKILNDFKDATNETVDSAADTAARHACSDLRSTSPTLTGSYAKGWAVKVDKKAKAGGRARVIVHNRTDYQLTHLLEHGHAKVVWGHRTGGRVEAKTHIKPVEEAANDEFMQLILSGMR